jgi:tetratricopeptide (TPR) repeat protein
MNLDEFLQAGWNDHADRPQEVADRLAASLHRVETPAHIAAFAHLLVHVYAEHLGQWARGMEVLESMRELSAFDGSPAAEGPIRRGVAVLRYGAGAADAITGLSEEDRVRVLATASSAFAGLADMPRAIRALDDALRLAHGKLPAGSPALRGLAAAGNNLASALESKPTRSTVETEGMLRAARAGVTYWRLAGTWLEEERAHYRLARSLLQAGDSDAALESARRCLAICEENAAPAFELFFGHAVVAMAARAHLDSSTFASHRASALEQLGRVPEAEQAWCDDDLQELQRPAIPT